MTINAANSLVRGLQHFVEFELSGTVRWDKVEFLRVNRSRDEEMIEIGFDVGDDDYRIRSESPGLRPPLGRVSMNGEPMGPLDETTWHKIGAAIRNRQYLSKRLPELANMSFNPPPLIGD